MRWNVYFKFRGSDGKSVLMPSSLNPFNAQTLAEVLTGLVPRIPDYTSVGVTPIGIVVEWIADPIMSSTATPITAK
jgi:hypothetical protein